MALKPRTRHGAGSRPPGRQNPEFKVLEQRSEGRRINTSDMTDLPTLAATLLSNFATIRLRRSEQLWTGPVPDPPLHLHCRFVETATRVQNLILGCNRQYLRQCLLDDGYRAFFDRLEGGGPDGWRLHFFCLDLSAVHVLYGAGLGECGPGEPVTFDAEEFVIRRLRQLEQCGRLDKPNDWWWFFD
jgi:hypothetical protein